MAPHPHKGPFVKRLKHVDAVETRQPKYTQGWYTATRAAPSPELLRRPMRKVLVEAAHSGG
jgi:hypothetical protein